MTQEFVTLPREVVEQALDALFMYKPMVTGVTFQHGLEAMQALSAALEQPQNHVPDVGNMVQSGWKLVPVEPTREMLDAARKDLVRDAEIDPMLKGIHSAILDAAPQPPVIEQKAKPACEQDEAIYLSIAANYTQQPPGPAYLLRDLADDISVDAVDLIAAIRDAGLGNYSINMKLPTRVCVAMCQKFSDAQQPQVEQEPVAWIENVEGGIGYNPYHEAARKLPDGVRFDLYTHPQPKREPLTGERIAAIYRSVWTAHDEADEVMAFARAIEAAHNIK